MNRLTILFAWVAATPVLVVADLKCVRAQDSLASHKLEEVVVTATRSERSLSGLPVPVTIVPASQIKNMGSLRLNDVLVEQTGLTLVSDHGTGVQMQGFSPEYTLILLDGEPLIGRTSGTLDLNRIAVGNIRRVEIMKGPSSSLYGSEALSGVINIITEQPDGTKATLSSRYGTNGTLDLSTSVNYAKRKFGIYAFVNRYQTNGYDLSPDTEGNTVSPFTNYTAQLRVTYDLAQRTRLSVAGRYFTETQESVTNIGTDTDPALLDGDGSVSDWNINPVFTHSFSDNLRTTLRFYASTYNTRSTLRHRADGMLYDDTFFDQTFMRPEWQMEYFVNPGNALTMGVGRVWETVEATRYDDKMRYHTDYAYLQYEWQPFEQFNLLAGTRYDKHSAYGSRLSPKLSLQYNVWSWLALRSSYGVGFKAPDFRQLYLNFTNTSVGYSVFGSQTVADGIRNLEAQGQIDAILVDAGSFGSIDAESSRAFNLGLKLKPTSGVNVDLNLFRNDIQDLIDTKPVALKKNGQQVFSYYNIASVFTQGLELDMNYAFSNSIGTALGYQYLQAKDKAVIKAVEDGQVFARDPETNLTSRVRPQDYGGLFNRSKHMVNAKVFYDNIDNGWHASARIIYRGRYGFADVNNNSILDTDSEYVDGYITVNLSAGKSFHNGLNIQAGCDNLFGYTDARYIPTLPGRIVWLSASVTLKKSKSDE